jgi:peptidoglycan biosynthesis protein MviN/MurJ (putative lipid II flippase)
MHDQRQIELVLVRSMGLIGLFAAVAGLARLAQDVTVAWRYGTGPTVDAYYFLLNLASWPVAVALATLSAMVAPTEAGLRKHDDAPARVFRAELLGRVLLAALGCLPLAWGIIYVLASSTAGGLEPAAAQAAIAGLPALIAMVPLGILGALLSAWFIASERHTLTLLEALPPVLLMAMVLAGPGSALFWGTSIGAAAQLSGMALILWWSRELPAPRYGQSSPAWPAFWQGMFAMLIGQVLFALVPLVDTFFATRLGDGTMSAISYANRLVLGLMGLIALALRRAGLPLLSRLSAQSHATSLQFALRWGAIAAGAGVLLALPVAALAHPLVSVLFERGRFTAEDRDQVAALLRFGMCQLPFFLGGIPIVAALTSIQARLALVVIPISGLIGKLLFCVVLVPTLGAIGLQLATALMYALTTAVALVAVYWRLRQAGTQHG